MISDNNQLYFRLRKLKYKYYFKMIVFRVSGVNTVIFTIDAQAQHVKLFFIYIMEKS